MSHIDGGFILLAKKILDSDVWKNKPAWWLKVWLYLLIKVNYTDDKPSKGFERGQGFFRLKEIRDDCQLFDIKVISIHNVVKWLKQTTQITTRQTTRGVIITICNYSKYQDLDNYKNYTENYAKNQQETTLYRKELKELNKDIVDPDRSTAGKSTKGKDNLEDTFILDAIQYLNNKAGKNYKLDTPPTVRLINVRRKDGFTLDDFKKVIDIKCSEWLNDPKYSKYLRPETLFGNKFESYLNEEATIDDSDDDDEEELKNKKYIQELKRQQDEFNKLKRS